MQGDCESAFTVSKLVTLCDLCDLHSIHNESNGVGDVESELLLGFVTLAFDPEVNDPIRGETLRDATSFVQFWSQRSAKRKKTRG